MFEVSSLRKTARSHRQTLLTDDLSDNIASHSHLVTTVGIFLAENMKADIGRVACMCVSHDWPETRSGDQNWLHKVYVEANDELIIQKQLGFHQSPFMKAVIAEYEERQTLESKIAKDADTIGQLILLKEYEHQGNREAAIWLKGRTNPKPYAWIDRLMLDESKELGRALYDLSPSSWWADSVKR